MSGSHSTRYACSWPAAGKPGIASSLAVEHLASNGPEQGPNGAASNGPGMPWAKRFHSAFTRAPLAHGLRPANAGTASTPISKTSRRMDHGHFAGLAPLTLVLML